MTIVKNNCAVQKIKTCYERGTMTIVKIGAVLKTCYEQGTMTIVKNNCAVQ